ncbi:hypothetical protein [Streptomyces cucumeris]|uniref:hypothetical protein n=1 Tax=Streptomyces cucumeris TaxID=2962890 RepID=UPI0020C83B32|nr:hypothetical protein [Streptomyces sp. NEAU-Y11]MCP9211532.1 hypothetical protein [Streptomyces sp. NEAU-Y11]
MGKASRGKKERGRDRSNEWTTSKAATTASRMRAETLRHLPGNPWVRMMVSSNINHVLGDMYRVLLNSDAPRNSEWDVACSMVLGKLGKKPPWPASPDAAAEWQLAQHLEVLSSAELMVISPSAHAAVMAAAATLEPGDLSTLSRDRDIVTPMGLLVLPEPVVCVNRTGTVSDTAAFGWQFVTQHQILPAATYDGVRISTFMDRDGPVQPAEWRAAVTNARASGHPIPRLVPDGMYGMRGDAAVTAIDESTELLTEQHNLLQTALTQASAWRAQPTGDIGEWTGGRIDDPNDDFACRYMFGFWRLVAQGVTTTQPVATPLTAPSGRPDDPDIRVVRLTQQIPSQRAKEAGVEKQARTYHHRWPVRMHKVRQWYPSAQEHRLIWRGPYIKGPADAPLMLGEKVYVADC